MPEPLPLGRPDRGEDGAGEPYDADDETEQHPEADEEQEGAGDCRQEYSEIEIERFQRLVGDERGFLPLREPDDERRRHRSHALGVRSPSPPRGLGLRVFHHYDPARSALPPDWMDVQYSDGPSA